MRPASNNPIHFINTPHALQESLPKLAGRPALALDLEFDKNNNGYGVTLCLVQVATTAACYVIDPLVNLDLSGLYALFSASHIQKIMHSPGEDLRLLHSLGCFPQNIYDTEIPARLLNYEQTSMCAMLREKLGVTMDKGQQRSNWLRRPLSDAQVQYAAEDVRWLHSLKAVLEGEAAAKGLTTFIAEEQEWLAAARYPAAPKTDFLKPADRFALSPRDQYIANELLRYRDELARNMNRPAYQVMKEEVVKELVAGTRTPDSLVDSRDVHPRFRSEGFARQLARRLERARKVAAAQGLSPDLQPPPRRTPEQYAAMQKAAADRETIFAPIQQALEARFGTYASKFLLSNRLVGEVLSGDVLLSDLPPYRLALMREIAGAKGIDLKGYEEAK